MPIIYSRDQEWSLNWPTIHLFLSTLLLKEAVIVMLEEDTMIFFFVPLISDTNPFSEN